VMVDRWFLIVERFIEHPFSYELVRESSPNVDGCGDCFSPPSQGQAGQDGASSSDDSSIVSFGHTILFM